jgi:hypothetical protein
LNTRYHGPSHPPNGIPGPSVKMKAKAATLAHESLRPVEALVAFDEHGELCGRWETGAAKALERLVRIFVHGIERDYRRSGAEHE